MKFAIQSLLLLIFVLNVSCSKKIHVETKWQSSEVKVDGNYSDWNIPLRFFDSNTQLNYEITNNKEGIFFAFRLNGMDNINQFNQNGITIELNNASSKSLSHYLQYPTEGRPPMRPNTGEERPDFHPQNIPTEQDRPSDDDRQTMKKPQARILLKGFSGYNKKVVLAIEDLTDIQAAHLFDIESEQLFCEIYIPYKSINPQTDNLLISNTLYNIILSLGSGENRRPGPPSGDQNGYGMQGGQRGNGGPPMGGSGPGGMQGGGRMPGGEQGKPHMQEGNKAQKIILEVKLSTQTTK